MGMVRKKASEIGPLSEEALERLAKLDTLPDWELDYSDIPPLTEEQLARMVRARDYRPVKKQITARIDADILNWLKSGGRGYQSRMNAILRRSMLEDLRK